ncbi:MAG: SGNH/GDSL hydrolase family protein [Bacteroidetes bacterium]|nr:SGNH/GDSL hydrolase family protein [Bacteroidota bacterium]
MKQILFLPILAPILLTSWSCDPKNNSMNTIDSSSVRYVALGDSYTICEGATRDESWPLIMANEISSDKIKVDLVANPSRTGWTTQDLIDNELSVFDDSKADVVTLLIGVNDWVQGVSKETFHSHLIFILDHLQEKLAKKNNIVLITIPDFGVTPTGKLYSGGRDISAGISEFNKIISEEAAKRELKLVDIFPVSKNMGSDDTLIAGDGLHPSAKEYAVWEKLIAPVMKDLLEGKY